MTTNDTQITTAAQFVAEANDRLRFSDGMEARETLVADLGGTFKKSAKRTRVATFADGSMATFSPWCSHAAVVPTFAVGDGATQCFYSDRHACTVVEVSKSGKKVTVQRDKATLLNGTDSGEPDALKFSPGGFVGHTSGRQRYSYERDADAPRESFTLRNNGRWVEVGSAAHNGTSLRAGRSEHYDFNF